MTLISLVLVTAVGCAALDDASTEPTPSPTGGPPPGASQAPGPPLATATVEPQATVDPTDPQAVARGCFQKWQSFDARTDAGPVAGVERARDCLTPDFAAKLTGTAGPGGGVDGTDGGRDDPQADRAWQELRAAGTRSVVTVLAVTPVGAADTTTSGQVALLLNVRRETVSNDGQPEITVSTPAVTMLAGTDGTWRIAGADLANAAGDAPGR
ncbi:hypothetical protein MXD63_01985 [Frankia sp. Cpl3]|uniref:hypothetical protein n=1 Tax=Parafrankia colletiae TaxID=573497 RepID=UPI001F51F338|nr:hypothetical protein [Parafrankia colletiae]MCK9898852.1 hypothetical protein [Frankia sp. Cpl3]